MTTRTYTTKSGNTFEWEENAEVLEAIKKLHQVTKENENATESKSTTMG